jgi:hypothetical protein
MALDPKTCHRHSVRCAEMARTARTPELRQTLTDLARSWAKMAMEMERNLARRYEFPPREAAVAAANPAGRRDQ